MLISSVLDLTQSTYCMLNMKLMCDHPVSQQVNPRASLQGNRFLDLEISPQGSHLANHQVNQQDSLQVNRRINRLASQLGSQLVSQ